jgi:predicted Co/Zn/Cd cation transporter (cation efflux family)
MHKENFILSGQLYAATNIFLCLLVKYVSMICIMSCSTFSVGNWMLKICVVYINNGMSKHSCSNQMFNTYKDQKI